jgi:hypothetical protein
MGFESVTDLTPGFARIGISNHKAIQVVELKDVDGELKADRDQPTFVRLDAPPNH